MKVILLLTCTLFRSNAIPYGPPPSSQNLQTAPSQQYTDVAPSNAIKPNYWWAETNTFHGCKDGTSNCISIKDTAYSGGQLSEATHSGTRPWSGSNQHPPVGSIYQAEAVPGQASVGTIPGSHVESTPVWSQSSTDGSGHQPVVGTNNYEAATVPGHTTGGQIPGAHGQSQPLSNQSPTPVGANNYQPASLPGSNNRPIQLPSSTLSHSPSVAGDSHQTNINPMGMCNSGYVCIHWQYCTPEGNVISDGTAKINDNIRDIPPYMDNYDKCRNDDMYCCKISSTDPQFLSTLLDSTGSTLPIQQQPTLSDTFSPNTASPIHQSHSISLSQPSVQRPLQPSHPGTEYRDTAQSFPQQNQPNQAISFTGQVANQIPHLQSSQPGSAPPQTGPALQQHTVGDTYSPDTISPINPSHSVSLSQPSVHTGTEYRDTTQPLSQPASQPEEYPSPHELPIIDQQFDGPEIAFIEEVIPSEIVEPAHEIVVILPEEDYNPAQPAGAVLEIFPDEPGLSDPQTHYAPLDGQPNFENVVPGGQIDAVSILETAVISQPETPVQHHVPEDYRPLSFEDGSHPIQSEGILSSDTAYDSPNYESAQQQPLIPDTTYEGPGGSNQHALGINQVPNRNDQPSTDLLQGQTVPFSSQPTFPGTEIKLPSIPGVNLVGTIPYEGETQVIPLPNGAFGVPVNLDQSVPTAGSFSTGGSFQTPLSGVSGQQTSPTGGGAGMMMMLLTTLQGTVLKGGACSASLYCVNRHECDLTKNFIIFNIDQIQAYIPGQPLVEPLSCHVPFNDKITDGVCCALPHPLIGPDGKPID